jgi:NAD(P)-dependent dehydrogenase (short-subunit alcohol dehydrogenase family)
MTVLEKLGTKLLEMDVTKNDTVVSAVERLIERQGQFDVLLANAAYWICETVESIPMEDIQYQYDVNVFGVARTLKPVLPHMRMHSSGRIIITASIVSHVSAACTGWY